MLVHTSSAAANNKIQQCDGARRSDLSFAFLLAVAVAELKLQTSCAASG